MFKFNKLIAFFLISLSASCYTSDYFRVSEYEKACRILGVSEKSSIKEIKNAYRNKAKIVHPDAGGTKESFQRIGSAYEYLNEHFSRYSQSQKRTYSGSNSYSKSRSPGYETHSSSYQSANNTYSGYGDYSRSNAYAGSKFYGIDEEIIEAIWRDFRNFDSSMTRSEFERGLQKMRSDDPFMYENLVNQYKASRNTSYSSSKSAYSGNTTSSSAYGSDSSYNRSQANSYSNASYSSNPRSTYNDSRNTASGFTNVNNSSSGLNNNSTPKKSIFSKIKGRYVVGAACCYGVYKYMNSKKKITTPELKPDNVETIAPVYENHFFGKLGNVVTNNPYKSLGVAIIGLGLGYVMYQKYMQKAELDEQDLA